TIDTPSQPRTNRIPARPRREVGAAVTTRAPRARAARADRVHQDLAITFTGMPTVAKLYVQRATVKDWRTHPCDAGKAGTSCSSWNAIPPTNGSAQGSHSRNGVDHQRWILA